jgi:uncharacterized protein YbjT (DUF2867 family)
VLSCSAMRWNDNVEGFVDGCVESDDAAALVEALRSVPGDRWSHVHARLVERLSNAVPGAPTPPLTHGEETGREVLSADELAEMARTLEGKRAIVARENDMRQGARA